MAYNLFVCVCVCFGVTYRDKDLEATVEDFYVLVLQQAAHDGYIGLCIRTALSTGRDLSSDTSRPVLAPPGVVCRDVKGQEVAVLKRKRGGVVVNLYITDEGVIDRGAARRKACII